MLVTPGSRAAQPRSKVQGGAGEAQPHKGQVSGSERRGHLSHGDGDAEKRCVHLGHRAARKVTGDGREVTSRV